MLYKINTSRENDDRVHDYIVKAVKMIRNVCACFQLSPRLISIYCLYVSTRNDFANIFINFHSSVLAIAKAGLCEAYRGDAKYSVKVDNTHR